MRTINIPSEKFVKYDESERAIIECIVCDTDKLSNCVFKDEHILLACDKCNVLFYIMADYSIDLQVSIYQYTLEKARRNQEKVLDKLFKLGVIDAIQVIKLKAFALIPYKEAS